MTGPVVVVGGGGTSLGAVVPVGGAGTGSVLVVVAGGGPGSTLGLKGTEGLTGGGITFGIGC